jgi:peptidyl-prolyl cis-trans isomerase C
MTMGRNSPDRWAVLLRPMLLAATLTMAGLSAQAQEVGVAARVNGVDISVFRLERYFDDYLKEKGRNVATIRNPTAYKRLKREALERLIDRELLAQEASRRATAITNKELAEARERVAAGYKTTEAFRRRLSDAGFTDASFNEYLRQDLMAQQALAELILETAEPEDTEVLQKYRENRERYVFPERVRARHILLRVNAGASEQEREAVRLHLLELAQQINNGADFAELARQYSEDFSRQSGGDLGYFSRGKMVPDFEIPAFGLPTGKLSEPVQTPYGWHLIRVEDHQAVRAMPEADAVDMIRRQLVAARRAEAERRALRNLRKTAQIDLLLPLR